MSLEKLTIEGFKSIRSLKDFELKPLNILIGANGAGKSNFIDFFALLSAMMKEDGLKEFVETNADAYLFGGPKNTKSIRVDMMFERTTSGRNEVDEVANGYRFNLAPTENGGFMINDETAIFINEGGSEIPEKLGSGNQNPALIKSKKKVAKYSRRYISQLRIFHFHDTSKEAGFWRYQDLAHNESLSKDGANIAPFLRSLKKNHRKYFDKIVQTIQLVLPFFKKFILKPNADEMIRLNWRQRRQKGLDDYPMRPTQLSDGAIRFICLATALLQPEPPSTIIIDEPELGLHPYAIEILAELIRSASSRMQVIVSTQSPSLIDCFDPEDVVVVDRVQGASEFHRLDEKALASWLEDYALGDLWKKNVLLGGPSYE